MGPPDQMKLSPDQVIAELPTPGYHLVQKLEMLPYQYALIFQLAK